MIYLSKVCEVLNISLPTLQKRMKDIDGIDVKKGQRKITVKQFLAITQELGDPDINYLEVARSNSK